VIYYLAASLIINVALLVVLLIKRRAVKGDSREYEEYLKLKQDLSQFSGGLIEFKRIDPASIFYRSMR
jgi:hypothetical protein